MWHYGLCVSNMAPSVSTSLFYGCQQEAASFVGAFVCMMLYDAVYIVLVLTVVLSMLS